MNGGPHMGLGTSPSQDMLRSPTASGEGFPEDVELRLNCERQAIRGEVWAG